MNCEDAVNGRTGNVLKCCPSLFDQILKMVICGFYGIIAIQMYYGDQLKYFLEPDIRQAVLIAGLVIFGFSAIQSIRIFFLASLPEPGLIFHPSTTDRKRTHRKWEMTCVRTTILAFPILLFFAGIPSDFMSSSRMKVELNAKIDSTGAEELICIEELFAIVEFPELQNRLEGRRVTLTGYIKKVGQSRQLLMYQFFTNRNCDDKKQYCINVLTQFPVDEYKNYFHHTIHGTIRFQLINQILVPVLNVECPEDMVEID